MTMSGGPGAWMAMRGYMTDESVKNQRLAKGTVRRIMSYASEFKVLIIGYLFTLVLDSLLVVSQPLLFKRIVDKAIPSGDTRMVTTTALLIALLSITDAALGVITRRMQATIGEGLIFNLRAQVFDHVQRQSIAFFTRAQTGSLISRLNNDVVGAQRAFTSTLGGVVGNVISLGVVVSTMAILSWKITLAALLMLPIFLIPARFMGRKMQEYTRDQANLNSVMATQMSERFNVSGALLMKLFGKPDREAELFADRAAKVRDVGVRIATANTVFFTAMMLVGSLATALVYGIGGNSVVSGALTLGTLLALVALLGRLYVPMAALANVRVDVMTALVSFERVFEVLDLEPMVQDAPGAETLPRGSSSVEFVDVNFRYPTADEVSLASLEGIARPDAAVSEDLILKGVNFVAEPGHLIALVGPSGAGKTTITSLVSRLFDPTTGVVKISGHDISGVTQDSLHDVVGVVTQEAHMFHESIRSNLLYANPEATEEQMWDACTDAQIADMIRDMPQGLDTVVGDRGHRLSGGEKQRLSIARLLLKAPDVVVLDEATAHLDSENEAAVQDALAIALKGRTSIVIAHRLSTIRQADQILVIDDGQVVEQGTHEELIAKAGLYADLHNRQFADSVDATKGNS
jgi:ATP-binding cassette subfamily B protein